MAITKTLFVGADAGGYAAWADRSYAGLGRSAGVVPIDPAGDARAACEVAQNPAGANWSVEIGPGWVVLHGTDAASQGAYAGLNSESLNLPNPVGQPSTSPRIDLVVATVVDSEHASGPLEDEMFFQWVEGTETPGADLDNLDGAPTLPDSSYRLAYVRLAPADGSITDSMIREDRVPSGPVLFGEDGIAYRLGVDADGQLGLEAL